MPTVSIIFAAIAGLIHVLFFVMESVLWMNPKVYKGFGITQQSDAELLKVSFFNQGFYNLFLAVGILAGIILLVSGYSVSGTTLTVFCCSSMLAASLVLLISKPNMLRGVLIQGLCPLIALASWFFL